MIDIHTHLYWKSYDADRDAVLVRAHQSGIEKMFVIGCTLEESRESIKLTEKYDELFASVGLHPHFFNALVQEKKGITGEIEALRTIAQSSKKVIAIGECGLDYYAHEEGTVITDQEKMLQKEGFLAQITLAKELRLPLIIHSRASKGQSDAYEDILEILKNDMSLTSHKLPCILHCYMGDTEVTKKFLDLPFVFFSFTANITYPVKKTLVGTRSDLTETVKMIPLERLFIETDCPFLAPQSKRGERNEPSAVLEVAQKIAHIQGKMLCDIEEATMENVKTVFVMV